MRAASVRRAGLLSSTHFNNANINAIPDNTLQTMADSVETQPSLNVQPFRLLELLAELRNRIYRAMLVCDEEFDIHMLRIGARICLLGVCTQIRSEASEIFYAENTFRITDARKQQLYTTFFLQSIGESNAQRIKRLLVDLALPDWARMMLRTRRLLLQDNHGAEAEELGDYVLNTLVAAVDEMCLIVLRGGVLPKSITVQKPPGDPDEMELETAICFFLGREFEKDLELR